MTESILTKLAVVVKDYSAYFKKNLNIFFAVKISTSANNNYSTLGGKVQEGDSYFVYRMSYIVKKIKERKKHGIIAINLL